MKTIGLIGGMSCESSAEYYRIVNDETKRRRGGLHNAESVMITVDFAVIEELQRRGEWGRLGQLMAAAALRAQSAGADFIVLCTNTMHKVIPAIEANVRIPIFHIADATAHKILAAGHKTVGLLGTRFTMEEDFYRGRLEKNFGLNVIVPNEEERKDVNRIIYEELCDGKILDTSRERYRAIIESLKEKGAEAVILGCTEITLLIHPRHSCLPVFDTTRIHAMGAVDRAIGPEAKTTLALAAPQPR